MAEHKHDFKLAPRRDGKSYIARCACGVVLTPKLLRDSKNKRVYRVEG